MIKFTVGGNPTIRLEQLQRVLKVKPKQILEDAGIKEVEAARRRILYTKQDPSNQRWAPWKFSTLQQRRRQGNVGLGLLNRTGMLLRSIYSKVTGLKVEIGSTTKYARYLQQGTSRMRPRVFLGWSQDSINKITKAFEEMFK